MDAVLAGTVRTAVEDAFGFHAMANDLASTMSAFWRKSMDGAFETVEYVRFSARSDLKASVVFVSAYLAFAEMPIASK